VNILPPATPADLAWPSLYARCERVLKYYDRWAPDDGRVAAALALAKRYHEAPAAIDRLEGQRAILAVTLAAGMAGRAVDMSLPLQKRVGTAPSLACEAGRCVSLLLQLVVWDRDFAAEIYERSGAAFLLDAICNGVSEDGA
jgi:hypothetical protein